MSRLYKLIADLCPNGVEYIALDSLVEYEQPTKYIVKSTDYSEEYQIPVLTAGQSFILGYTNETEGIYHASEENPVIIFDDFTASFKWVDFKFKVKSSAMKILKVKSEKTFLRYIYHVMGRIGYSSDEHKRLWISRYSTLTIPVPHLEVQREIVRILDSFMLLTTELTAQLATELTARKKQYEYYRNHLLSNISENNTKRYRLSEIADIQIARSNTNEKSDKAAFFMVSDGVEVGSVLRCMEGKYALHQRGYRIHINVDTVMPEYLFHYMKGASFKYIKKNAVNSSVTSIPKKMLEDYHVPVPTFEVQEKIVRVLDEFETICSELKIELPVEYEARKKEYEYYRDILLIFVESGEIISDKQLERKNIIRLIQYVFGVVALPLSEICHSITSGKAKTREAVGEYPVYGSTGIIARTNKAVYNKTNILIARVGANAGYTHLAQGSYDVSDNTLIIEVRDEYNLKYVYYQLVNMDLNRYAKGAGQPLVTAGQIKEVVIPVPSVQEQEHIVTVLDRLDTVCNDLTNGLPAEIDARKKQYEYYRDKILSF